MTARGRAILELVLAVGAVAGCVACWVAARSTVVVPPILDGEPSTTSITYYAPLVMLAFLLAALAGVLAVVGAARWHHSRPFGGR